MKRVLAIASVCFITAACATKPVNQVSLPAAPPPGEPTGVEGMGDAALRIAFGAPAFTRQDGDAQMWRYDGAACHAFFFLYPQNGRLVVRHVETTPRPKDSAVDERCLNLLRKSPPAPVS